MIKKRKKRAIYSIGRTTFNTFKAMKAFVWYNSYTDEKTEGFEIIDDEVQKHYIFTKKKGGYYAKRFMTKTKSIKNG